MARYDVPWGEKTVLVLESRDLDGKSIGYYFVDHEHQSIFWLDPFYPPELDELMIDFTLSHIGEFLRNIVCISFDEVYQVFRFCPNTGKPSVRRTAHQISKRIQFEVPQQSLSKRCHDLYGSHITAQGHVNVCYLWLAFHSTLSCLY